MKRLDRKWIEARLNEGKTVQCAITASNAYYWCYLTTSGQVCRAEFGYVEDADPDESDYETLDIPKLTFSSVGRLNRVLAAMFNK